MGGVGSGQLTKLINQLLFDINVAALAEILPMAVKMGLDPDLVGDVVNSGTGRSYASEFFIPRILKNSFSDGYPMKHAYKDLVSAAKISADLGIPLPVLGAATTTYQMALLKGFGDLDKGGMILRFRRTSRCSLPRKIEFVQLTAIHPSVISGDIRCRNHRVSIGGLTNYGDRDFALYLRRSFARSMGFSQRMLEQAGGRHRGIPERIQQLPPLHAGTGRSGEARRAGGRRAATGVSDHLAGRGVPEPDQHDVPQPDGDGHRGDDPRAADGRGRADRRLRQDRAGAVDGRGVGRSCRRSSWSPGRC